MAFNVQTLMGLVIVVVVASAVIGIVADNIQAAQDSANVTGTDDTIVGLFLTLFLIAILVGIVGFFAHKRGHF